MNGGGGSPEVTGLRPFSGQIQGKIRENRGNGSAEEHFSPILQAFCGENPSQSRFMVRVGIGTAIVPEAAQSLHFDDVHFRPIVTAPTAPVELYAVWREDNENPALRPFLDLLGPQLPPDLDSAADED